MSIYTDLCDALEGHLYDGYFYCVCPHPDHSDSRPSMSVWEDADKPEGLGRFKCSACGYRGTHNQLWKLIKGGSEVRLPSLRKEQKFLPRWAEWQKYFGNVENLAEFAHQNVKAHSGYDWYFKKRKVMELYEPCMLGMKDSWAMFPIFDPAGKVIDILCRNTQKFGDSKYVVHPDNQRESPYLYVPNWKRVTQSQLVYIVYGIIDALALELSGLPVITGSTGKALSNKRLIQLNKKWCIIPDRHEEGAARELANSLGRFTKVLRLPFNEDEKDPDDVRMKRGNETLRNLIENKR